MQNEEWNVSAVSLSPELVRLAQQKQARNVGKGLKIISQ